LPLAASIPARSGEADPPRAWCFFLGGGFLELSGSSETPSNEKVSLWLQVPDVDALERGLGLWEDAVSG
jgi:hypothetical protein